MEARLRFEVFHPHGAGTEKSQAAPVAPLAERWPLAAARQPLQQQPARLPRPEGRPPRQARLPRQLDALTTPTVRSVTS